MRCSWPKIKSIETQASDFLQEMMDTYGYAPLDELRDDSPEELISDITEKNTKKFNNYDLMKEWIRPDILYVTDSSKEMQEMVALLKEKRDIRATTRKEIGMF